MKRHTTTTDFKNEGMENLPCAFLTLDLKGNIVGFNSDCAALFGFNLDDSEKGNINDYLCKGEKNGFSLLLEIIETMGKVKGFGASLHRLDGELRSVEISASMVYDRNGNPLCINCILRDVGKEQMFDEQLKEELEFLGVFFENAPIGIAFRVQEKLFSVNDTLANLLDYPKEHLINYYLPTLVHTMEKSKGKGDYMMEKKLVTGSGKKTLTHITKCTVKRYAENVNMEILLFDNGRIPTAINNSSLEKNIHSI